MGFPHASSRSQVQACWQTEPITHTIGLHTVARTARQQIRDDLTRKVSADTAAKNLGCLYSIAMRLKSNVQQSRASALVQEAAKGAHSYFRPFLWQYNINTSVTMVLWMPSTMLPLRSLKGKPASLLTFSAQSHHLVASSCNQRFDRFLSA